MSGYYGRDVLGMAKRFGIDWGNATATIRWNHLYYSKLFGNTSVVYSDYDYKININDTSVQFSILSRISDWNLKQEFQNFPDSNNEWKFGYNIVYHNITPGQVTSTTIFPDIKQIKNGLESAIYVSNNWQATKNLKNKLWD